MFRNIRRRIEEIKWEDATSPSFWVRFAKRQARLCFYMLRELVHNRCMQQASALTFTTLLSLVPLLAVAFSFFRAFGAVKGWESRAQEAIFATIFADALVEGEMVHGSADDPDADDLASVAAMTPGQIVAAADELARRGAAGRALRRHVAALNAGADADRVRQGMMVLRFSTVGRLAQTLSSAEMAARQGYMSAAGLTTRTGQQEGAGGPGEPRNSGSRNAQMPGPRVATLLASAEDELANAEDARAAGNLSQAEAGFRAALSLGCDGVVLAAWSRSEDDVENAVRRHERARAAFGEFMLETGRAEWNAHVNAPADPEEAQHMEEAVRRLEQAAVLQADAGKAYGLLGQIYEKAGAGDKALEAYSLAIQEDNAAAARGISLRVVDHLRRFVDQVGQAKIGVVGTLVLIITATALLNTIEQTLNHIWKVTERRAFWARFTSYCTLLWLGPVLFGASIWLRGRMNAYIEHAYIDTKATSLPLIGSAVELLLVAGSLLVPFLTIWFILLLLYRFLPNARVRFRSAAWGALFGAILLQLARPLFSQYAVSAFKYEHIYGRLGVVPLFLLWIWLLWMIVLFGAEVAFTTQHVALLRYHEKLRHLSALFVDRYVAARMTMYVALRFWQTGQPANAEWLARILQTTTEEAADTARRLVKLGLLRPVGEDLDEFHPARDLSRLKLSHVLSITDRYRDESRSERPEDNIYEEKLESVFRSAIEAQEKALGDISFHDLLEDCENGRGGQAVEGDGET